MTPTDPTPLARALGRVPSGLFIVTTREGGDPKGFVASFVNQVGLAPPTVCVAVGKARGPLSAIRAAGHFGVSVLDAASRGLMSPFFKRGDPGSSPFDGLSVLDVEGGVPVLADSLAWLACRVTGEHETQDHVVVFGEVIAGELLREGEPACHTRKSGLDY